MVRFFEVAATVSFFGVFLALIGTCPHTLFGLYFIPKSGLLVVPLYNMFVFCIVSSFIFWFGMRMFIKAENSFDARIYRPLMENLNVDWKKNGF